MPKKKKAKYERIGDEDDMIEGEVGETIETEEETMEEVELDTYK